MKRLGRWEPVILAVWGGVLGLLFGVIMNIWFWPFLAGGAQSAGGWQPGMPIWDTVRSYAVFYMVTSLWWDMGRAAGNALTHPLLWRADLAGVAPVPASFPV